MSHILDTAWRHSVEILETDLVRKARHIANAAEKRPAEIDFGALRTVKHLIDEALSHELR
jgi:hypothetical protein